MREIPLALCCLLLLLLSAGGALGVQKTVRGILRCAV